MTDFAEDKAGTVWASTSEGLARLEGSHWRAMGPADGYSEGLTTQLLFDSAGTLWTGSFNRVRYLAAGEKMFRELPEQPQQDLQGQTFKPTGLAETKDVAVWFLHGDQLMLPHKNKPSGRGRSSGFGTLVDRDGALWFDRHAKLQREPHPESISGPVWDPPEDLADSLSEKDVASGLGYPPMLEDSEGSLWFAALNGLCRLAESDVKRFRPPNEHVLGITTQPAMAAGEQGTLWLGTNHSPLFRLRDNQLTQVDDVGYVSSAVRADDGVVWFGYIHDLWKVTPGGVERLPGPENKENRTITAIAVDAAGRPWISVRRSGAFRFDDGVWTLRGGLAALPPDTPWAIATDSRHRVWFGYDAGTVAALDGSQVSLFTGQSRVPIGRVTAIYGKRGRVWAGGAMGLAVLDGAAFREVKPQEGPAFDNITGIVETADGDVWLESSIGFVRIPAAETHRVAKDANYRVKCQGFDALDGVLGLSPRAAPLPSAIDGTDGRIWFSTTFALYWVDPEALHRKHAPANVLIQAVRAGGKVFPPGSGLRLPSHTTSVQIDYVSPNLTMAEKVRYRYMLDGVDDDWQDVQGRRQAFYPNLAPGTHRFRVIACNSDGVWNESGAVLDFDIPPTFVQTRWFTVLCVVAGGLAIWALVRLQVHLASTRLLARHAALTAERSRIARELHDTLLQSTQSLIVRFQRSANGIPDDSTTRADLEEALDRADQLMEEGRDRVLALRHSTGAAHDLQQAVGAAAKELALGVETSVEVSVEGAARELIQGAKDEAIQVVREALSNAIRHACATSIRVRISYADDAPRILVRDNGVGIEPAILESRSRPGHWGLAGMAERAQQIGAQIDIRNASPRGTSVELTIPAALAYQQLARRWPSAVLRRHREMG